MQACKWHEGYLQRSLKKKAVCCHNKLKQCRSSALQMLCANSKDMHRADANQHSQVDILEGAQEVALKQQVLQRWETSQVMQLSDMIGRQN